MSLTVAHQTCPPTLASKHVVAGAAVQVLPELSYLLTSLLSPPVLRFLVGLVQTGEGGSAAGRSGRGDGGNSGEQGNEQSGPEQRGDRPLHSPRHLSPAAPRRRANVTIRWRQHRSLPAGGVVLYKAVRLRLADLEPHLAATDAVQKCRCTAPVKFENDRSFSSNARSFSRNARSFSANAQSFPQ